MHDNGMTQPFDWAQGPHEVISLSRLLSLIGHSWQPGIFGSQKLHDRAGDRLGLPQIMEALPLSLQAASYHQVPDSHQSTRIGCKTGRADSYTAPVHPFDMLPEVWVHGHPNMSRELAIANPAGPPIHRAEVFIRRPFCHIG